MKLSNWGKVDNLVSEFKRYDYDLFRFYKILNDKEAKVSFKLTSGETESMTFYESLSENEATLKFIEDCISTAEKEIKKIKKELEDLGVTVDI